MVKKICFILTFCVLFGITILLAININILVFGGNYIINEESDIKVDAILVLGASVHANQTPSPMLKDRLDKAIEIYKSGLSNKIIMSGDHADDDYNEVTVMKNYAISNLIPQKDVYLDHYGVETYASMYNIKNVFDIKRVLIVTQKYHLYRAIYIARSLGIDAYGIPAEDISYSGQEKRDIREIGARIKAFFTTKIKKEMPYNGEKININNSGELTNIRK